ncbi:MAG: response regulator receiver protein [Bacteroidetes bacterium]|jgi:DNA-binding NtrC family response regulator|nr:response regulator receiver protein [Bacteroidota bacterium]
MKTILVVDNESGSSSIEAILQRRGFRGIIARSAREALIIIRNDRSIDLVVTEMQLPDMDGLHFLTAVRSIAQGLPIIVATNSGSIESYLHAVNLGVYEYLNKPVLPKELIRIASIALANPRPSTSMREAS